MVRGSGGETVGERGAGGGELPARDGAVPRVIPPLSDQGARQARHLQVGEWAVSWEERVSVSSFTRTKGAVGSRPVARAIVEINVQDQLACWLDESEL